MLGILIMIIVGGWFVLGVLATGGVGYMAYLHGKDWLVHWDESQKAAETPTRNGQKSFFDQQEGKD